MSLLAWWYRGRQFLVKGGGKGYVEGGRRREFGGSNPQTHLPYVPAYPDARHAPPSKSRYSL